MVKSNLNTASLYKLLIVILSIGVIISIPNPLLNTHYLYNAFATSKEDTGQKEVCGDKVDNDGNGKVDEGCDGGQKPATDKSLDAPATKRDVEMLLGAINALKSDLDNMKSLMPPTGGATMEPELSTSAEVPMLCSDGSPADNTGKCKDTSTPNPAPNTQASSPSSSDTGALICADGNAPGEFNVCADGSQAQPAGESPLLVCSDGNAPGEFNVCADGSHAQPAR